MSRNMFLALTIAGSIAYCSPPPAPGTSTFPCGKFTYKATLEDGSKESGNIYAKVGFHFNPSLCGTECSCKEVAYIQMIRIVKQEPIEGEDNFFQPTAPQRQRMVLGRSVSDLNGWAIDRNEERSLKRFGYYGVLNDGSPGQILTMGSNTSEAWIEDRPWISFLDGRDPLSFEAVSVPVCRDSEAKCVNCLLGYHWWAYDVDGNGKSSGLADATAIDIHRDAMDEAVKEWNSSESLAGGREPFPPMTRL